MIARCEIDGYPVEITIGSFGRTISRCTACERRAAGLCMDCGAPTEGTKWRCEPHRRAATAANLTRYRLRSGVVMTPHQRAEWLERRRTRKWLKERKRKQRQRMLGTNGYRSRERFLAYQAQYNAKRAEAKRVAERERYHRKKAAA